MLQFFYKILNHNHNKTYSLKKKWVSLSSRSLILLKFGAELVVNESAFHADVILLLMVNFLTLVLLYSTYNLYSAFLVVSDLVGLKKLSNFKSSV